MRQALSTDSGQKAVGGVAAAVEAYASEDSRALLTHILAPWAMGVARLAFKRWKLPTQVTPACAFEEAGHTCGSFAVGGCHVCGRPICLGHAFIAGDATLVCWPCMRLAAKHAIKWVPPSMGVADDDLVWAFELLGVEPDASEQDIRVAYRKRIKQFHPDQHSGDAAHADMVRMFTKAMKAITEARRW